jgi:hypothetical protein
MTRRLIFAFPAPGEPLPGNSIGGPVSKRAIIRSTRRSARARCCGGSAFFKRMALELFVQGPTFLLELLGLVLE